MNEVMAAAERFINQYGLLTRQSAAVLKQRFHNGEVQVSKNLTPQEAVEALNIVNSMSYKADPERYDSGGTTIDREAGQAFLSSPMKSSPEFVNAVRQLSNSPSYTAEAERMGYLQNQQESPEQAAQRHQQAQAEQSSYSQEGGVAATTRADQLQTENAMNNNTEHQQRELEQKQLDQVSKIHNGFKRESNVFNQQPRREPNLDSVSISKGGSGYERVSQMSTQGISGKQAAWHLGNRVIQKTPVGE